MAGRSASYHAATRGGSIKRKDSQKGRFDDSFVQRNQQTYEPHDRRSEVSQSLDGYNLDFELREGEIFLRQERVEKFISKRDFERSAYVWEERTLTLTSERIVLSLKAGRGERSLPTQAMPLVDIDSIFEDTGDEEKMKNDMCGMQEDINPLEHFANLETSKIKESLGPASEHQHVQQAQVVKRGLLFKREARDGLHWHNYYFIVGKDQIMWFSKEPTSLTEDDVAKARNGQKERFDAANGLSRAMFKGWMCASGLVVSPDNGQDRHGFHFSARAERGSGLKSMELASKTAEERQQWVDALRSISTVQDSHALEINGKRVVRISLHNHVHFIRFNAGDARDEWLRDYHSALKKAWIALDLKLHPTQLARLRVWANRIYNSHLFQQGVGLVLVSNFLINMVEAEVMSTDYANELLENTFVLIDNLYMILYVLELVLNLFVNWWKPFISDGWSLLDLTCIIIGIIGTFTGVASAKIIRSVRILRIVRIFRRFRNLQHIVLAVSRCVLPLCNTMVIILIVNVMYAVIAVELYGEYDVDQFGSFSKAALTMFQVGTGDGWMTDVVRPLQLLGIQAGAANFHSAGVAIFFISYIMLVYIVLVNVMVSVLLEGFISSFHHMDKMDQCQQSDIEYRRIANNLDPLILSLAGFSSTTHLESLIDLLFSRLDADGLGTLCCDEFQEQVAELPFEPRIMCTFEDWEAFTGVVGGLNQDGMLTRDGFRACIHAALKAFANKLVTHQMNEARRNQADFTHGNEHSTVFLAHKIIMMDLHYMRQEITSWEGGPSPDVGAKTGKGDNVAGGGQAGGEGRRGRGRGGRGGEAAREQQGGGGANRGGDDESAPACMHESLAASSRASPSIVEISEHTDSDVFGSRSSSSPTSQVSGSPHESTAPLLVNSRESTAEGPAEQMQGETAAPSAGMGNALIHDDVSSSLPRASPRVLPESPCSSWPASAFAINSRHLPVPAVDVRRLVVEGSVTGSRTGRIRAGDGGGGWGGEGGGGERDGDGVLSPLARCVGSADEVQRLTVAVTRQEDMIMKQQEVRGTFVEQRGSTVVRLSKLSKNKRWHMCRVCAEQLAKKHQVAYVFIRVKEQVVYCPLAKWKGESTAEDL